MDGIQCKDLTDEEVVISWFSEVDVSTPKAMLVYDPFSEDFEKAVNGYKYSLALWDLDQWLRTRLKYHRLPRSMDIGYNNVRIQLREIMHGYGIKLD